jgi:cytoplasmic iron level regulating protein YaaA (DUF328/UPF0246 family)
MLTLLSPAKRLDFESPVDPALSEAATRPAFAADAVALIEVLRTKSRTQVAGLMHLSDALAELNVERYAAWRPRSTARNSRPAVTAFAGDVYVGLDATTLSVADLRWAQQHLVILSGLYGALRPLDRLQPYRLEMGTRLATDDASDLYGFWGDRIAAHLDRRLRGDPNPLLLNLASQEYFHAVDRPARRARVVHVVFEDAAGGPDAGDGFRVVGVLAKRARGRLARHVIRHRIDDPAALRGWRDEGYAFAAGVSAPDRLVFRRRRPRD